MSEKPTLSEQWDALAVETMAQVYRRAGVEPGDHIGYLAAHGFFDNSMHAMIERRVRGCGDAEKVG